MTEPAWPAVTMSERLLNALKGRASDRKLRLYGVACARRAATLLGQDMTAEVLAVERFADGLLPAARDAARALKRRSAWGSARAAARSAVEAVAHGPVWRAVPISQRLDTCEALRTAEKRAQVDLLRDLFGHVFLSVALEPAWLTPRVAQTAQAIYEGRRVEDLPILADALEDAGCGEAAILDHCRGPGPHVRGCWAVDLLLGKE
jgi:hypothetical protein